MRELLALIVTAAVALPAARAAASPESVSSAGLAGFERLLELRPKAFKAQRKVHVSGSVELRGNPSVQDGDTYVVAVLFGSAKLSGEKGRVRGEERITKTATLYLYPSQAVISQKVDFQQKVRLTCGGQPAGTANIGGQVLIKGIRTGGLLILSGSQAVEGDVLVDCPEEPAAP